MAFATFRNGLALQAYFLQRSRESACFQLNALARLPLIPP
jgi:hypothetical protein